MLCEKCQPRELEAMRALESLTPSGSEFANDPKRCAEFVKDRMRTVVKYAGEAKSLRGILARILSDLPANRDWLDPTLEQEAREAAKGF